MSGFDNAHSTLVSVLRGGRGWRTSKSLGPRPEQLLVVYEFESCPFCRKVRETLSELDLDYVCRTTPRDSSKREELRARGGKVLLPYLIDPNTGVEMYESEDIIDYLRERYGSPRPRAFRLISPLNTFGSAIASIVRPRGRKTRTKRGAQPPELLELYGYEASPYCRKAREALNELDLDYLVRNVAKRGRRRDELRERGGRMMVPYLVDPNKGVEMYESDDIVRYLHESYG